MLKNPNLKTVMDLLDEMEPSARYQLNWVDVRKLLRSLGLAFAGLALMLLSNAVLGVDWQSNPRWGPLLGAMAPVLLNYLRKLLAGPKTGTGTVNVVVSDDPQAEYTHSDNDSQSNGSTSDGDPG